MAFPKIDGFVVTEKLGSGSYSTVYKAYPKVGPRSIVAIKCVDKSRLKNSESGIDNLITEIRLLKTLKHPHIVQMIDFSWDDKRIFIQTEYCNGGDLSKYIKRSGRIQEKKVKYFLQQLASALKFLREQGVAHMDLKPHNLLLHKTSDGKYILKVTDFGFAQYMSEETRSNSIRGSPLYMAPEMLTAMEDGGISYDAKVDLWSVGVIIYECLFGKAPYCSNTMKELLEKIRYRAPIEIPKNAAINAECADLLTRLLQHDPGIRISYEDFFNHSYLDLDHMPSKENYEKAVNLVKKAIDLDSKRQFETAFEHYCQSLRYLVPFVNSETDPVRRSALKAKVLRYMNRAEELKTLLDQKNTNAECVEKAGPQIEPASTHKGRQSVVKMCPNQHTTESVFIHGEQKQKSNCNCTISNTKSPEFHTNTTQKCCPDVVNTADKSCCDVGSTACQNGGQANSAGNDMFCFGSDFHKAEFAADNTNSMVNILSEKSLEERGADVPYLEANDSSVMNDTPPPKNPKKLFRENSESLCAIQ